MISKKNNLYIAMPNAWESKNYAGKAQINRDVFGGNNDIIFANKRERVCRVWHQDVIIDLEIGFCKDDPTKFLIFTESRLFRTFPFPIMVGVSRKSIFIEPLKKLSLGSTKRTLLRYTCIHFRIGANILRVHDV